jgi:hypothetical protein
MTSLRLAIAASIASLSLISCGSFEKADSRYPTVSQQDAYDVQWGLEPRKSRGNPKLRYQYNARNDYSSAANVAPAVPAPEPVAPAAPAPIDPTPTVRPAIPSTLR